jgi:hypothetical protein
MSLVLLILGILATGAGIVSIGFGIPVYEYSLGNTLIVAGTMGVAAGLVLIGLAAAVEQLTQIAKAMQPRASGRPVLQAQPAEQGPALRPPAPPQFPAQPSVPPPIQAPVPPLAQMKPAAPVAVSARSPFARPVSEERPAAEAPSEPAFSAIERLRASLVRPDRKGEEAVDAAEDAPPAPAAAPAMAARPAPPVNMTPNAGPNGAAPPPSAAAAEASKKPPLDFLFRARSRAPQPPDAFDDVWPKRGPRRDQPEAEPPAAEPPPERPARVDMDFDAAPEDMRPAAILKSGVVDGMAYTLYADGSIEAQLPQGTVRFGSIAELRSHIENSS